MEHAQEHGHIVDYATFVRVWLILLLITAVLVYVSTAFPLTMTVWAMLTLTPLKAGLVFYYFMHLKYEKPYLRFTIFITLALLTLFIGLVFMDIKFR